MKALPVLFALVIIATPLFGQKNTQKNEIKIPLNAASWDSKSNQVKFAEHNGVPSMEITSGGELVTPKNLVFSNGTIEYDVEYVQGFTGLYFRRESDDEGEFLYLRERAGDPVKMDAVQYTPIIKKVNFWDMLPDYQAAANFNKGQWTHIKMIVSGSQMLVYVNEKSRPTLYITRLEGNTKQGSLAFGGQCFISNVIVRPNEVEGLSANEGFDPTHHDNRYIRSWQISQPFALPPGQELNNEKLPDIQATWQSIAAERRGLINMTRLFGNSDTRRAVWLRTKVISKREQKVKLDLGFSDEVWVFVNDRMTYVDKNLYAQEMRKVPDGRISVNNSSFEISLREGENDLLLGVANDFFGWGIIARLDNLDGITLDPNYKLENIDKALEPFFGMYASKQVPFKIKVTQKNNKLSIQATGQGPLLMESAGNGVFKYDQFGVVLEFTAAESKMVLKQGNQAFDFVRE